MNHTQTYKLSQWEKTDRILMSDFNADNAKLENALSALAARDTQLNAAIAAAKQELNAALAAAKAELAAESARLDGAKPQWTEVLNETYGGGEASHEFNLAPLNLSDCWFYLIDVLFPTGNTLNLDVIDVNGTNYRLRQDSGADFPRRFLFCPMKDPMSVPYGICLVNTGLTCPMGSYYAWTSKLRLTPNDKTKKITGTGRVKIFVMK